MKNTGGMRKRYMEMKHVDLAAAQHFSSSYSRVKFLSAYGLILTCVQIKARRIGRNRMAGG
jgi:hypothetical protein